MRLPRLLRRETLLDVPYMRVRQDLLRLPDGSTYPYTYRKAHGSAAVVVPITADGSAVLVRQYRHPIGRVVVEFPAGAVNPGESPAQAARRELLEETGYRAGRLVEIGRFFPQPASASISMVFYLARNVRKVRAARPERTESLETVLWPVAELERRARRIRTPSSLFLTGIYFAQPHLGADHGRRSKV